MLLRNYDNLMAILETHATGNNMTSSMKYTMSKFGDGYLGVKNVNGAIPTYEYISISSLPFFVFELNGGTRINNSSGRAYLICGYENNDVTYDDYKIDNQRGELGFVSHSATVGGLNENNELVTTYTKILCNTSNEDITVNCIGIETYGYFSSNAFLLYKEKIPEITIPAGANIVLKFIRKSPLGQNKPADYVATASVE